MSSLIAIAFRPTNFNKAADSKKGHASGKVVEKAEDRRQKAEERRRKGEGRKGEKARRRQGKSYLPNCSLHGAHLAQRLLIRHLACPTHTYPGGVVGEAIFEMHILSSPLPPTRMPACPPSRAPTGLGRGQPQVVSNLSKCPVAVCVCARV